MSVRVRYAPSPTGFQHIGGVRTALYDYLYARKQGGAFVLRIEDTDRKRFVPEALQDIYDTFTWLGFHWDEGPDVGGSHGPYFQSERLDLYRRYAEELLARGYAYRCYCTPERLAKLRESQQAGAEGVDPRSATSPEGAQKGVDPRSATSPEGAQKGADQSAQGYDRHCRSLPDAERAAAEKSGAPSVIRLKIPLEGSTTFRDELLGEITVENKAISPDPVLIKSDGFPTYHMALIVDDHLMEITHTMRGQEWLPSAPIHKILFDAFGWEMPLVCHLPMVMGKDGHKLSKRLGSTSVRDFRAQGYLPEALLNCIALVGWSYDDQRELFTLKELVPLFDIRKLSKSPGVFDYQKLEWFNGVYIRAKSRLELAGLIAPFMKQAGLPCDDLGKLEGVAGLVQERVKLLSEVPGMVRYVFDGPAAYAADDLVPKKADRAKTADMLESLAPLVDAAAAGDAGVEGMAREIADRLGVKLGDLLMPLRVAVTGSKVSPPLFESIALIGRDRALAAVDAAIGKLRGA
ncbi:MAG: glutamate--tRNA ligase [Spirochaetes bacterium RBG_13_68_11]|nr:MAG: glutamate--tRNA ligase [Spirochaetes bacterium RBG_13_68_11]